MTIVAYMFWVFKQKGIGGVDPTPGCVPPSQPRAPRG